MKNREAIVERRKEPARLLALSDGLFATVLTLLVLDLRIPDAVSGQAVNVHTFLQGLGAHLFSYLLTFLVAGVYWEAHHRDFDYVINYDRGLQAYNLLFLLFIGLLPFSTAAVSRVSIQKGSYPVYWAIYAANIILAGVLLTLTWLYALSHGLVDPALTAAEKRRIIMRRMVTPAAFLLSIAVEFLFPRDFFGPIVLLLIPLAQPLVDRSVPQPEGERRPTPGRWASVLWQLGALLIWLVLIGMAIWAANL